MKLSDRILSTIIASGLFAGFAFAMPNANPATFTPKKGQTFNADQAATLAAAMSNRNGSGGMEEEAEEPGLSKDEVCKKATTLANASLNGTLKARSFTKQVGTGSAEPQQQD